MVFSALIGTAVYQLATTPAPSSTNSSASSSSQPVEVVDCLDCIDTLPNSCELESNECADSNDCSEWLVCIESCVTEQGDASCYDDCDVAHSDVHNMCSAVKTCACDTCVGQCVDFCMADDL